MVVDQCPPADTETVHKIPDDMFVKNVTLSLSAVDKGTFHGRGASASASICVCICSRYTTNILLSIYIQKRKTRERGC